MSDVRNQPPTELLEMFERREGDVRPAMPMPPSVRRRVRTRRGVAAAAIAVACAALVVIAVKTLPDAFDRQPARPNPPSIQLFPTATGHTELFNWRVMAGPGDEGRLEAELQISSLAGGEWTTVSERSFDPTGSAFSSLYLESGQYLDHLPSATVVWGFLPDGAHRVVLEPGAGCDPITVDAGDAVASPGAGNAIWATNVRCAGQTPGSIVAQGADGAEIATNGYATPIPTDVWSITRSRTGHGGVGWVLRRIVEQPTGVGVGDGGHPDEIASPIRADELTPSTSVVWDMTPPAEDGRFVFGIAVSDVDHVTFVLPDGSTVVATVSFSPGDTFNIFWADVPDTPVQLTAFDADCKVLANESMNGGPVDPPSGACTPNG